MPRPTVTIPTWATTGTKLEPPTGKRALGWVVDEPPPAEWWNHLQYATGEWLTFLNAVILGEATADLALRFAQSSAAADIVPLLAATNVPAGSYRLVARFPTTSASVFASLYVGGSATRKLMLVYNASWTGTQWTQNSAAAAQAIAITAANALDLLTHSASPASWADNAWSNGSFAALTASTIHATLPAPGVCALFEGVVSAPVGIGTGTLESTTLRVDDYAEIGELRLTTNVNLQLQAPLDIVYDMPLTDPSYPWRYVQLDIMRPIAWPTTPLGTLTIYGDQGVIGNTHATNSVWVEFPLTYIPRDTERIYVELTWRAFGPTVKNLAKLIWWPRAMTGTGPVTPPANTYSQIGTDIELTTFTPVDVYVNSATFTGLLVVNNDNRYSVLVQLAPGSALYGIRLGYADPGPRNG